MGETQHALNWVSLHKDKKSKRERGGGQGGGGRGGLGFLGFLLIKWNYKIWKVFTNMITHAMIIMDKNKQSNIMMQLIVFAEKY